MYKIRIVKNLLIDGSSLIEQTEPNLKEKFGLKFQNGYGKFNWIVSLV